MKRLAFLVCALLVATPLFARAQSQGSTPCLGGSVIWTPTTLSGGNGQPRNLSVGFIEATTEHDVIGVQTTAVTANEDTSCGKNPDTWFSTFEQQAFDDGFLVGGLAPAVVSVGLRNESCTTTPRTYQIDVTCYDADVAPYSQAVSVFIQTSH